ncbi:MAG: Flp family type IVb pilin [Alphaproteobacteria bacterium]
MTKLIHKFLCNEVGATAIEYGMIAGLVFLAIVSAVTLLGTGVSGLFTTIESAF